MRSSLQPTLFSQDLDFKTRFESLSNQYAFNLMLLNLEFLQKELTTVGEKLKEVDIKLKTLSTDEEYKKFSKKKKQSLELSYKKIKEKMAPVSDGL